MCPYISAKLYLFFSTCKHLPHISLLIFNFAGLKGAKRCGCKQLPHCFEMLLLQKKMISFCLFSNYCCLVKVFQRKKSLLLRDGIKNRKLNRFNSTVEFPGCAFSDFYRTAIKGISLGGCRDGGACRGRRDVARDSAR